MDNWNEINFDYSQKYAPLAPRLLNFTVLKFPKVRHVHYTGEAEN